MTAARSFVTFVSSAFNMTEPKETYVKESNFGDDLIQWFAERLPQVGCTVEEEIGQDDDGWYLTYRKGSRAYDLVVQLLNADTGLWLVTLEPAAGVIPSLLGARKRGVPLEASVAIHDVLKQAGEIETVRWFTREEFLAGEDGKPTPVGP